MKEAAHTLLSSVPPIVLFMGAAVSVLSLTLLHLFEMLKNAV